MTLRRLGEIAVRIKYLEVPLPAIDLRDAARRGTASGRPAWPRRCGVRSGQEMAALAFDVLGARGAGARWAELPPDVALADHRRRHHADQQEHHRAARTGVAAQMNLELTEEQVALRDTTRRFLAEKAPISGHVRPLLDDADRDHRSGVARPRRPGHHRSARAGGIRRCGHDDGRGRRRRSKNSAPLCIRGHGCRPRSPRRGR